MESLTLYRELGNKSGQAMVLADLAMIIVQQGDQLRATRLYNEALVIAWQIGDRRRVAFCLEGLSTAAVETDPEHATYWLSAAGSLRESVAAPLPPSDQAMYDQVLQQLQYHLSPAIFGAAWQYGQLTSLEEVIAPLLAEGGARAGY
jgi:hypothetical protein